ncbi:MAG: cytochrome c maturation protein CcmE [Candidatus Hodarchaeota archaeon]
MVKTKNIILASTIIIICAGAFFLLLASSSVPLFTVKELMDHPSSDSFINKKIQLIGNVQQYNSTGFFISDPDEINNGSLIIYINSTNIEKPTGFEEGRNVIVEGKLLSTSSIWKFRASSISTKCPSKYQENS